MNQEHYEKFSKNLKLTIKPFQKVESIYNGRLYQIIITANETLQNGDVNEELPIIIVYKDLGTNAVFAMQLSEFTTSFQDAEIYGF